ncbi:unnamed protein product [Chrysodeixis includens]|uniref:Uncharacterized protein n=1 Tax=Chrysodeixis includens TaxID=689277 RepID=A0A9N8PZ69_CHRIL|nr:unnamed protein product [Chrysodeixis includens]
MYCGREADQSERGAGQPREWCERRVVSGARLELARPLAASPELSRCYRRRYRGSAAPAHSALFTDSVCARDAQMMSKLVYTELTPDHCPFRCFRWSLTPVKFRWHSTASEILPREKNI